MRLWWYHGFNNNLEISRYAVKIKDARRASDRTVNIFEDLDPPQDIGVKSGGFISISFIVEYVREVVIIILIRRKSDKVSPI